MMHSWSLMILCLGLAACDRPVVSRQPLFAKEQTGPAMRPGVWLYAHEQACAVDTSRPTASWPDCAEWTLIAQSRMVVADFGQKRSARQLQVSLPFDLEAGEPVIMQMPSTAFPGRTAYKALKPLRSDPQGLLVEVSLVDLVCPPPGEPGAKPAPLPQGMRGTRNLCYADNADAVRRLAITRLAEGGRIIRWVRDGDH